MLLLANYAKIILKTLKMTKNLGTWLLFWPTHNDAKNLEKSILKPRQIGTHLRILNKSRP